MVWRRADQGPHELHRKTGCRPLTDEQTARFLVRPSEASYGPGAVIAEDPTGSDRHDGQ